MYPKKYPGFFPQHESTLKNFDSQKKTIALLLVELQCYQPMETYNPARYWPKGDLESSTNGGVMEDQVIFLRPESYIRCFT